MAGHPLLDGDGPFTVQQALAAGLPEEQLRRSLRGGSLRRLHRGVYVAARAPDTLRTRALGLLLVAPEAVVSHESAAMFWGVDVSLPGGAAPEGLRVTVPPGSPKPQVKGVRVTQAALGPGHVWWSGGLPLTTPGRTAADLARSRDLTEAVVAADALAARWPQVLDDLPGLAAALPPGARGAAVLRAVVQHVDARAESPMESRLRMALVLGGLPRPVAQHEVRASGRFVARLDLAYPELRLGLEYDGRAAHPLGLASDRRRARDLLGAGWAVLHFTVEDLRPARRDGLLAEVARLRAAQEGRRAAGSLG